IHRDLNPRNLCIDEDKKLTLIVDIWSMATILFEVITGQVMFEGKRISNSIKQQIDYCGPVDQRVLDKVKTLHLRTQI
ncbi:hypothetical protein PMAYCL1PPCAC_09341, partial [Pristionchus mayeri]